MSSFHVFKIIKAGREFLTLLVEVKALFQVAEHSLISFSHLIFSLEITLVCFWSMTPNLAEWESNNGSTYIIKLTNFISKHYITYYVLLSWWKIQSFEFVEIW